MSERQTFPQEIKDEHTENQIAPLIAEPGNYETSTTSIIAPMDQGAIQNANQIQPTIEEISDQTAQNDQGALINSYQVQTTIEEITDQMRGMGTVFGQRTAKELQDLQQKPTHLSAGFFYIADSTYTCLHRELFIGIPFTDPRLKIPLPILESLTIDNGFTSPSHIQATTLPMIMDNRNIIAQGQSGSGKTIAFVIGMLQKIDYRMPHLQALCVAPTRELAKQIVDKAIIKLTTRLPNITWELALKDGFVERGAKCSSHIIVGTPGTIMGWEKHRYIDLRSVKIFVLDEADEMISDTLGTQTKYIRSKLDPRCQILFFSATFSPQIFSYARQLIPKAMIVRPRTTAELVLDVIFQIRLDVSIVGKLQALKDIYELMKLAGQSIIFLDTIAEATKIAKMMNDEQFEVSSLNGSMTSVERDVTMKAFIEGKSRVLITTNVLSRGVDIENVQMVVNYELPVKKDGAPDAETYLHRIGRCGRFGRRGTAISFVENARDQAILDQIEQTYVVDKRISVDFDGRDIKKVAAAIGARPAGGELAPEASGGNTVLSITTIGEEIR